MSLADDLNKLNELHFSGALSDAEFEQAKAALLQGSPPAPHIGEQLNNVHYDNELARIDREWEMERQQYLVRTRYGVRTVPTAGMGIGMAIVAGVFGTLWTIMAIAITGAAPAFGPFAVAKVIFPLFGVFFILFGIGFGVYCYKMAQRYEEAFRAYQVRRQAVRPERSR
jgi:hypothetical protein